MEPITANPETAQAEANLEWLLVKLHSESLRRRPRLTMPVLIGGTALRRAYRLTRPSTDLDFAVANEQEMKRILRTVTGIARERWPGAKANLRQDNEVGWRIDNEEGQAVLHIGGLTIGQESLALAQWVRETWTLPITRLATMKIKAGIELRSKTRDLYDMGFLADQYPGDITQMQAEQIRIAGWQATLTPNRWAEDYELDRILNSQKLEKIGQDTWFAAESALKHIEGARKGLWENQGAAAATLHEATLREPLGTWETHETTERVHCVWRTPRGEIAWEALMQNEHRVQNLLVQANVEGHPHVLRQEEITGTAKTEATRARRSRR